MLLEYIMKYQCNICNKEFSQKSNYEYHTNRKRPCVANENKLQCKFCLKNFKRSDNLLEHLRENRCIVIL